MSSDFCIFWRIGFMNSRKVRFVKKILISLSMACCVNFNVQGMNNQFVGNELCQQDFGNYQAFETNNINQVDNQPQSNNTYTKLYNQQYMAVLNMLSAATGLQIDVIDYICQKNMQADVSLVKKSYDYLAEIYGLNANPSLQDFRDHYINTGSFGSVFKVKEKNENKDKVVKICFYDKFNFNNQNSNYQKNWILSEFSLLAELKAIDRKYKEKSQYLSIPGFVGIYDKSRYKIESKPRNNFENEKNSNRSEKIKDNSFVDRESKFLVSEYEKADCDFVDFYKKGNLKSLYGKSASAFLKKLYIEVLTGLSVLHKSGLVHGDIKPDNILMSSNGNGFIFKLHDRCIISSILSLSKIKQQYELLNFQNVRNINNTEGEKFAKFLEFFQNNTEGQNIAGQINKLLQNYYSLSTVYNYYSEKNLIRDNLCLLQKFDMYMLYDTLLTVFNNINLNEPDRKAILDAIEDLKYHKNAQEALDKSNYVEDLKKAKEDFDCDYKWIPGELKIEKNKILSE